MDESFLISTDEKHYRSEINISLSQYDHLSVSERKMARVLSRLAARTGYKEVNTVISLMKNEDFSSKKFLETFPSAQSCTKMDNIDLEMVASKFRFRRKMLTHDSGKV